MRHLGRAWLTGIVAVALAAGCEQTLHLYQAAPDGGGNPGAAGSGPAGGGRGGKFGSGGSRGGDGGFDRAGTGGFDGGAPDGGCFGTPSVVNFTPDAPQMVIALDRSTSMNQPFLPDTQSQLNGAISDITAQIYEYSSRPLITFSYLSFPDWATGGCQAGVGCCSSDASNNWTTFWGAVAGCANSSPTCVASPNRPIAAVLAKAATVLLGGNSHPFQRYVLLVTDGSPKSECSSNDCTNAQTQASMLASQSIKLRVIGIGDPASVGTCPKNIATSAGDLGRYYAAPSDMDLQNVLDQAIADAACGVTLNSPSPSGNLQVSLNGTIPFGSSDGWTYDSMNHLRLHGRACSAYVMAPQALSIMNGCGGGRTGSGSTFP